MVVFDEIKWRGCFDNGMGHIFQVLEAEAYAFDN